ncbi:MAG TPA: hypothetical protein VKQ36_13755, partial [Ktedonobacterales bacterium]|nr:hypothetical protein [Ktedonobacterales bacterium]
MDVADELSRIIRTAGMLLKHAVGVAMLCWRRMLRAGLIAGVTGVVIAEIVAMFVAHSLNPGGPAQLAA